MTVTPHGRFAVMTVCVGALLAAPAAWGAGGHYGGGPLATTGGKLFSPFRTRQDLEDGVTLVRLANGLTLIVRENHTAPVATVRAYVRNTGSVYEGRYLGAGISHLVEHLVSGGTTPKYTEQQKEKELDAIGGATNAFTSRRMTAYYIDCASRHVPRCIHLLADQMQNCTIPDNEFKREKGVVIEELKKGHAERSRVMWALQAQLVYRVHPARHPIIGYLDPLVRLTRQDVVDFYHSRYRPENIVMVVVGDVAAEPVIKQVTREFAGFRRRAAQPIVLPAEPSQVHARRVVKEVDGRMADLSVMYRTVDLFHPDLYPLDLLAFIVSRGDSTRLPRRLKFEKRLVVDVHAYSLTPRDVAGYFCVRAKCAPGKLSAAESAIIHEMQNLWREPVTPSELRRANKQMISSRVFANQTVQQQAGSLASDYLSTGDPLFYKHYVDRMRRVTVKDIARVARQYFQPEQRSVAALVPTGRARVAATQASAQPVPSINKTVLPNGLTVLVKSNPAVPLVAIQVYVRGGVLVETDQDNGVWNLMMRMLRRGTRTRTADQIAAFFDSIGAQLAVAGGHNTGYVTCQALREDFTGALEVVADMIQDPAFAPKELGNEKRLVLGQIQSRADNWYSEMAIFMRRHLPARSIYRRPPAGMEASVSKLAPPDLRRYHRTYCVPNNMVLAVFGDVPQARVLAEVRKRFGAMPRAKRFAFPKQPPVRWPVKAQTFRQKTAKSVAAVTLTHPAPRLTELGDRTALDVLDTIISGYAFPGGWLHTELRGNRLVYVVHAYSMLGPAPGVFVTYAACQPANTAEVLRRVQANLSKAHQGQFTADELARAKRQIIEFEQMQNQTNSEQAQQAALDEIYGLGYNFREGLIARVRAVTMQHVKRVGQQYLARPIVCVNTPGVETKRRGKGSAGR